MRFSAQGRSPFSSLAGPVPHLRVPAERYKIRIRDRGNPGNTAGTAEGNGDAAQRGFVGQGRIGEADIRRKFIKS